MCRVENTMCEPTTILAISTAVSLASTAYSAKVQSDAAEDQAAMERQALIDQRNAQGEQLTMQALDQYRQNRSEEARIRTALGERGGIGNAQMDTLLQGLGFGEGLQSVAQQKSAEYGAQNFDRGYTASGINLNNTLASIQAKAIGSGIETVSGAADKYAARKYNPASTYKPASSSAPSMMTRTYRDVHSL